MHRRKVQTEGAHAIARGVKKRQGGNLDGIFIFQMHIQLKNYLKLTEACQTKASKKEKALE